MQDIGRVSYIRHSSTAYLNAIVKWKVTVLAVVASLTLATASAALAGSGVGGVFNLGKTNTVNAITKLTGSVTGDLHYRGKQRGYSGTCRWGSDDKRHRVRQ